MARAETNPQLITVRTLTEFREKLIDLCGTYRGRINGAAFQTSKGFGLDISLDHKPYLHITNPYSTTMKGFYEDLLKGGIFFHEGTEPYMDYYTLVPERVSQWQDEQAIKLQRDNAEHKVRV